MKTRQIDTAPECPTCHRGMDGVTSVDHDEAPKPGDITVCLYCSQLLLFGEGLATFRVPTAADLEGMTPSERRSLATVQRVVVRLRSAGRGTG